MFMPMLWTNNNDLFDMMRDPFDDMDHFMSNFFGDAGSGLESAKSMRTDVIEEDGDYKVKADLPGFDKKDISVSMKDGVLTISAAHQDNKDEKDEKTGKYIRRERVESSYQRSFTVGDAIRPEEIAAAYENGVLTLTIPKKNPEIEKKDDVKQIEIH